MVPATKQEIFQGKTFVVAKSKLAGQVHVLRNYQPFDFILFIWMFRFWWGNDCLGEIFSSSYDASVWKAEEINVTFTKSILMVLCHLEYWYSRCPHQTTPIQLNWKLGFYRNIHDRTKRFFLLKIILRLFICTIIICWKI